MQSHLADFVCDRGIEYDIVHADGSREPLLRVNYHFHWQLSYRLVEPRRLAAGTRLEARAWYDNSDKNPHNPDTGPGEVDHLLPEYEKLLAEIAETRAKLKQELHHALTSTAGTTE